MLRCGPLVLLLVAACNPSTSSSATTNAAPVAPVTAPNTDVPFKAAVTTKQLMAEVLEPAANVYWEAVGSTTDARGTVEKVPKTDAEWTALRDAATIVAESGNLLMLDARARNHDEWMTLSRGLIDVGVRARAAAESHDSKAVFDVGADVYEACVSCHRIYLVGPKALPAPVPAPAAAPAAAAPTKP